MSVFVTRSSASTNPFSTSSLVRAARLRRYALIFDQQFSIGLNSGELDSLLI